MSVSGVLDQVVCSEKIYANQVLHLPVAQR